MALSIVNNNASLNAQQSLGRTSGALSKSLERLSSGLKVNRGADGPAALVISEQQRAQIAGLRTAIDNTNKAVSVVQTAEGALNEVNSLLTKVRGLALDSANSGVNDSNALAANQAEITNALSTINNIANNTKFGSKNLLNGAASISGSVTGANTAGASAVKTSSTTAAGTLTVTLSSSAAGGSFAGGTAAAGTITAADTFTVGGGGLTGTVGVALDVGDNLATIVQKTQAALDGASAQGGGKGKFVVDTATAGAGTAIRIRSNVLGSAAVTATGNANIGTVAGLGSATATTGTALTANVSLNGGAAQAITATTGQGLNNEIKFGGSTGVSFSINVSNGAAAASGTTSSISVTDNALVFQIGANQNETAKVSLGAVNANKLAVGVTGLNSAATTDLSKVDVTTSAGAQDAIKVVDAAINQVSTLRGEIGAFQTNTLESNARNLSATLENTVAAESVIRDTDFAEEIANFTRLQTQQQAGSTVLGNANQTTQLVAQLLRG
jgi:flagellin